MLKNLALQVAVFVIQYIKKRPCVVQKGNRFKPLVPSSNAFLFTNI